MCMPSMSSTVVPVEIIHHNETRKIPRIVVNYNKGMGELISQIRSVFI